MKEKTRIEKDTLGEVLVPYQAYWGAQTARSLANFRIGHEKMPQELILALVLIKKAAANANFKLKLLSSEKNRAISKACDEVLQGLFADQFPLSLWQTGSGTQTNMNVNEVIANRANEHLGFKRGLKKPVHPNDDVNLSQSSNDVFPSAIHIAACLDIQRLLLPTLDRLHKTLKKLSRGFDKIIKVGRTHLMDAAPLTLGQEFSGYASQIGACLAAIKSCLPELHQLALGGTAVGTGLNSPKAFAPLACKYLSEYTGLRFKKADNSFASLAASDGCITASASLKRLACALFKIANDIRWMASGPRSGIGELLLPENEPGSSIMPGKVNPTQCEALMMCATQVIGFDVAVSMAGAQGNFELNVMRPLIAYNLLRSIHLLHTSISSFEEKCLLGLQPNRRRISELLSRSLMQATALNPVIGYDKAAQIVRKAHKEDKTLKQAAKELGHLSESLFDSITDPKKMISPE